MNEITFKNVLPQVFVSAQEQLSSDIWLKEVTFQRGKNYLVEAESGKGKSTFCSYIMGYRHDYSGQVLMDGTDCCTFQVNDWIRLRQQHVSCLFQELRLFPELTAFENVDIKNRLTHHKTRKEIESWFERLEISDKLETRVGQLSFGQQQRVALLRALVQPFDFLLADEPVSHLDDRNAGLMAEILVEEAQHQGASIIATSIGKRIPVVYEQTFKL